MKRREFIALIGMSAAWPALAQAQQQPRLGLLSSGGLADWAINGFRAGLEDAGYVEGRNLTVIYRSAENQFDRLPALAAELVKSQVSIIFATGSPVPARSAKAATSTIPIVFAYGGDPVGDGLVESFSRPGGNVTGATFIGTALTSKRMEALREILPHVSDVGLLVNPKGTLADVQIKEAGSRSGLWPDPRCQRKQRERDRRGIATMSRLKCFCQHRSLVWLGRSRPADCKGSPLRDSGDLQRARGRSCRWPCQLRRQPVGHMAASRCLCRPHPEGRKALRTAGCATHQVRTGHKSQDGKTTRHRGAANAAKPRRRGDRVANVLEFLSLVSRPRNRWDAAAEARIKRIETRFQSCGDIQRSQCHRAEQDCYPCR